MERQVLHKSNTKKIAVRKTVSISNKFLVFYFLWEGGFLQLQIKLQYLISTDSYVLFP